MSTTFKIKKNNYYKKSVTIRYSTLVAYDLTNKSVKFTVKSQQDILPNDIRALLVKTITVFTNAALGQFDLEITDTDTINMQTGTYKFDFRIEDLTLGQPANTIAGIFILEPIVTIE